MSTISPFGRMTAMGRHNAEIQPLTRDFFQQDAVIVARELLGVLLIHRLADGLEVGGRIVETEAYRGDDPASHSYRGPTARNKVMFGPAGHAYVYFIYGMYDCFNVVCEGVGSGAAVLVRALEPTLGLELMWANRYPDRPLPVGWPAEKTTAAPPGSIRNLTSGPGKLCRALEITRTRHDGVDLTVAPAGEGIYLACDGAGVPGVRVAATNRIGITRGQDRHWRFVVAGSAFLSRR